MRLNKDETAYRRVGDEFYVLTTRDSTLHNVRGAGVRIIELLEEGKGRGDILAALLAEFEVDEATLTADVDAFLAALAAKGVLLDDGG
jgi:hypothetical protein